MMLLYILLGAAGGSVFCLLMLWIEQFSGAAISKVVREELDRERKSSSRKPLTKP
jgi:hypothetical protein